MNPVHDVPELFLFDAFFSSFLFGLFDCALEALVFCVPYVWVLGAYPCLMFLWVNHKTT